MSETETQKGVAPAPDLEGVTPMMAQFLDIKAANPGYLLFYRMGDFYELFFEDAVTASEVLGITLTKRGKHRGEDIPMAGVPIHAAEGYLEQLIAKGLRIAVCEQTEDPAEAKKRGAKAVVRREVVRLVTPGTLTEDAILEARANNFLAALNRQAGETGLAIAWIDMSTGDLRVKPVAEAGLKAELARLSPSEILLSDRLGQGDPVLAAVDEVGVVPTVIPAARFGAKDAERRLSGIYGVASLDGYGRFAAGEIGAMGAVIDYVELTQRGKLPLIKPPEREAAGHTMAIDPATRRNLELIRTLAGERRGSLLETVDRTITGPGSRVLAQRIGAPLTDPAAIHERFDCVAAFLDDSAGRRAVRETLRRVPDIERALARLSLGRGGPRDLAAIRDGLDAAQVLRDQVAGLDVGPAATLPTGLAAACEALAGHAALVDELRVALAPELPLLARDGGFIREGYHAGLDEFRSLGGEGRRAMAGFEARYRDQTGIGSLKIRHNNILGYFVEVTATHADKLMTGAAAESFIHRQTMANAVRFTTSELADLEQRMSRAGDQAMALELTLFDELLNLVLDASPTVAAAARAIAEVDVAAANAALAGEGLYCRPVGEDSATFAGKGGRHPVVEAALAKDAAASFVANDCRLDGAGEAADRIALLTGPNMAGKSTFLRQNALIAIMAQAGLYVPAQSARIGVVDALFSRVGASDDLARGRSTFMVEMVEAAAILNQAGPRSLVILDELGRGTATFDGLSLAWAALEHLHEVNRCRSLFATHYHELTALTARLEAMGSLTMRVKEWKGDVIFLHEVAAGAADRSYGIQVAKLAGLPPAVIERARAVLAMLEEGDLKGGRRVETLIDDLPLFAAATARDASGPTSPTAAASPVVEAVTALDPDSLTPREALEALYRLKGLLDGADA